jgi:hypothetical protein
MAAFTREVKDYIWPLEFCSEVADISYVGDLKLN